MDGVDELAHIVLAGVVAQIEEVEVPRRVVDGAAGKGDVVLVEVVDGDGGRAVSGPVGKVRDHLFAWMLFAALQEMGRGGGREHPVAQDDAPHPKRAQKSAVFLRHRKTFL